MIQGMFVLDIPLKEENLLISGSFPYYRHKEFVFILIGEQSFDNFNEGTRLKQARSIWAVIRLLTIKMTVWVLSN